MFPLALTVQLKRYHTFVNTASYGSMLVQNQQYRDKNNIQNVSGRFSSIFSVDLELLKLKTFKVVFLLFS